MLEEQIPLLNYYKKSWKFILISTFIITFVGFIYAITETPEYEVSTIVTANRDGDQSAPIGKGIVKQVFGGIDSDYSFYSTFKETFYSIDATEALNNKENTLFKIYGSLYDEKNNNYKEIVNLRNKLKKIKWRFYGIDFEERPNIYMLNNFIRGNLKLEYSERNLFIDISSLTCDPKMMQSLMEGLLQASDQLFKSRDKVAVDAKIEYLYAELKRNQDVAITSSIATLLQSQLLQRALIDSSGASYKFKEVRGFETSEYPVYPNFTFLIALFSAFGLIISLGYKTYYFVFRISNS